MGTTIFTPFTEKRTHPQGREIRNCTKGKKSSASEFQKETCLDEKKTMSYSRCSTGISTGRPPHYYGKWCRRRVFFSPICNTLRLVQK